MTNEQAKSELMQLYGSLSEEKKQALDVLMAQADGEYISREAVIDIIEDVCPIYGNDYRYILREKVNELPSVAIPNKTEPKQALYEIRETIDDWWDKRIITNHTVYKMLRKLVEEKMYRD